MVLEERIPAISEDAAKEIIQYLKNEGISARIGSEPRMSLSLILEGKYENLKRFLKDKRDRKIQTEIDNGFEDDDIEKNLEEEHEEKERWGKNLAILEADYNAIIDLSKEKSSGDYIGERVYRQMFLDEEVEWSEDEFSMEISLVRLLMSNKLCELTDNGFTLTKNVQPEEITLYINYSHPLPPDIETCEQYTIRCIRHIKGDLQFFVQTGPDIIFIEDIEDFLTYLVDKSVPLYDVMRIAERLTSKMSVIQEFLDKIFVSGEASLDYLRLLFVEDVASRDEEGFIQDRFGLTPAFIDELTSDLRKVKVIKGKDSHLKIIDPARNKSEKKR